MATYFITVCIGLDGLAQAWSSIPRDRVLAAVGEFRHLAESIGDRYGAYRSEFTDDGHKLLFQEPETAVRFGLALLQAWARERDRRWRLQRPLTLRLGCHFGECILLETGGWLGRSASLARAIMGVATPDSLLATESVIELLDAPLYRFQTAGEVELEGDHLPRRTLYQVTAFDRSRLDARPPEDLDATEWFLRGIAKVGTREENTESEAEEYGRALRLRPDYPEAHNNLAIVLRTTGDAAGAAYHYLEALRLRPNFPDAHYNYAILLASTGRPSGAVDHLQEALALRPDYTDAHHAYANLLRDRHELVSAEAHYLEALRLRPDDPEVHNNLAILLQDRDEPQSAAEHYREALRLRPDYAEAHYNLALLLEATGDNDEAEREYDRALAVRSGYPEAHNNLAIMLQARGSLDAAEAHYRAAIRLRPADPEAHHNLGLLLRSRGRASEGAEHLRISHELAPDSPVLQSEMEVPIPVDPRRAGQPAPPASGPRNDLTGREMEVTTLVAEGLTNRLIATRMGISERTVEKHIQNVMNKLGFFTRAQIATWTARRA